METLRRRLVHLGAWTRRSGAGSGGPRRPSVATGAAMPAAAAGGPTCCSRSTPVAGDVGSFLRVPTCRPSFVSADRYRPARFRLVSGLAAAGALALGRRRDAAQVDGTPRRAGVYRFTIAATDALGGRATGHYTVQIHPELVLPGGKLGPAAAGAPYWARVAASGGKPPYTYGAFSLDGLDARPLDRRDLGHGRAGRRDAGARVPLQAQRDRRDRRDGERRLRRRRVSTPRAAARSASCSAFDGPALTWVQGIAPRRGPFPMPARAGPSSRSRR